MDQKILTEALSYFGVEDIFRKGLNMVNLQSKNLQEKEKVFGILLKCYNNILEHCNTTSKLYCLLMSSGNEFLSESLEMTEHPPKIDLNKGICMNLRQQISDSNNHYFMAGFKDGIATNNYSRAKLYREQTDKNEKYLPLIDEFVVNLREEIYGTARTVADLAQSMRNVGFSKQEVYESLNRHQKLMENFRKKNLKVSFK